MAVSLARVCSAARLVIGLATVTTCSVACFEGELGTVGATAKVQTDAHLSIEQPVAVRRLTFASGAVADAISAGIVVRGMAIRADGAFEAPPGVSISVRPDDPALIIWREGHPDESLPGASLSFSGFCRADCNSSVMVVVRLEPGAVGATDVRVVSEFTVVAPYRKDRSLGVTPTAIEDAAGRFDGAPASAVATATHTIRVTSDPDIVQVALRIHAAAAVLGAVRRYPLVGSLELQGVGDASTHAALASFEAAGLGFLHFNDASKGGIGLASEGNSTDFDWLARCPATGACDLAYTLWFSWSSLHSTATGNAAHDNVASPSLPASFQLELHATAILEAFDGRTLDAGGLTVMMEPAT